VLLTAPIENLAAETVRRSGGGIVVEPDDANGWIEAGRKLAEDAELRASLGAKARQYAEATFDIGKIADRFEAVLIGAAERRFHDSPQALRDSAPSAVAPR
jgi:colanic acid biosynthesis glycosyl transferase WcaI